MTRFWITLPQAVDFVISCFDDMVGGELYVPRIPSMHVTDLVRAFDPNAEMFEIGIRPGEKLHEEMISSEDSRRTLKRADRYIILPTQADWGYSDPEGEFVEDGFSYTSDKNDEWLSVDDIRQMLQDLKL
jgi:UDP-N-acetylglucosamine 4,6-dehydratase